MLICKVKDAFSVEEYNKIIENLSTEKDKEQQKKLFSDLYGLLAITQRKLNK